jgi:hypothetical protein
MARNRAKSSARFASNASAKLASYRGIQAASMAIARLASTAP